MSIKITIPNTSSDVLTFGSSNTPTAAQIAGIDSGSSNGQLALYTTASGTSTERVRVDSSGNVGIGTTGTVNSERLSVWTVSGSGTRAGMVINNPHSYGVGVGTAASSLTFSRARNTSEYVPSSQIIGGNEVETTSDYGYMAFNTLNLGVSTERMRINSSGNVGIGVTPSAWGSTAKAVQLPNGCAIANLGAGDVVVTQNAYFDNPNFKYASTTGVGSSAYRQIDGTHRWSYAASGTAGNNIAFTEAMRIDSSGRLMVGTDTTGANAKVTIKADSTLSLQGATSTATGSIYFLNPAGNGFWSIATNTSNLYIADADFTNFAYVGQNFTAWSFASDRRIKQEIENIDYGLSTVMAIQSRRYKLASSGKVDIGFIAQELKDVVPEAVTGEEIPFDDADTPQERAGKIMGVSKETLIPVLVKAIQEQQAIIQTLTDRVSALDERLTALENK